MTTEPRSRWLPLCWLVLTTPAALACGELPNVQPGVCGNGVLEIENGEDCDTFAESGTCRPPTAPKGTGCHYDCSVHGDSDCPKSATEESHCGLDAVCHYSSDQRVQWGEFLSIPSQSLQLGDFDGDGREDLLALGSRNGLWQAYPRMLFFDDKGYAQDVIDPRIPISSPIVMALDQDDGQARQSQQLVFSSAYGIGAAEVTGDRTALPIPYPIQVLPEGWSYRIMRLGQVKQSLLNEIVVLFMSGTDDSSGPGEIAVAPNIGRLGTLPRPVSEFAGAPVAADLVTENSPCEEAVFAFRGENKVYLFEPCDTSGDLTFTHAPNAVASLPGAATVGQTPLPALVNPKDTNLDLLISDTSSNPYVTFGRGDGTFAANLSDFDTTHDKAWPISVTRGGDYCEVDPTFPLAVADLNGDGLTDWVTHKGVQLTQSIDIDPANQRILIKACILETPYGRQWSIARVADVNGDERLDVIAGSDNAADLDLWRGTGLNGLNQSAILTGGPVHHLATGDFDGDGVRDIVFDALRASHDTDDRSSYTLSIAFGRVAQPPDTPIGIGNFTSVEQIETALYEGLDTMAEIGVVATPGDSPGQQLSVFIGSDGRHPIAPMGLQTPGPVPGELVDGFPLTLAAGKLLSNERPSLIAASGVCDQCENRLWIVPNASGGKFAVPMPSVVLPDTFVPYRLDDQELSVQLFVGDVNGDNHDDAFAVTTDAGKSNVYLWRIILPQNEGWADAAPVELLSATPGRLIPASNPKLVDVDADGHIDLVIIIGDANGAQRLGIVKNQNGALDISQISYLDVPDGRAARAFATDHDGSRLFVISDAATYAVVSPKSDVGAALHLELVPNVPGGISIAVGDLAGYGLRDLAIGNSDGVQLYREVPRGQ